MSKPVFFMFIIINTILPAVHDCMAQEDPYQVAEIIGIKEGWIVGEAGAGDGYYSFLFAGFVGKAGHIYVNEIDRKILKAIERQSSDSNITNITTVKGNTTDPLFPVDTLDMVFLRHVLHCMKKPEKWLGNLGKYMNTGALLVIIDGDPDIVGYGYDYLIKKEEVINMVQNSGYTLIKLEKFLLPEDYIYIFQKN